MRKEAQFESITPLVFPIPRVIRCFFTKSLRFGDSLARRMKSTLTELAGGFHDRGRVE